MFLSFAERRMNTGYKSRFQALAALTMKTTVVWDMTPCSLVDINRCIGGTYCLHLQRRRVSPVFNSEDGGSVFLRNVGQYILDYMALHPRKQCSLPVGYSNAHAQERET
jgi:hypothetical protein